MNINVLIIYILCVIIISKILLKIYNLYTVWREVKYIPGEGYPFIGLLKLIKMSEEERATWYLSSLDKYKGRIFKQWLGGRPHIHVFNPEFLQTFLASTVNIEKGSSYTILEPWLGKGLLTSTDDLRGTTVILGSKWFHDRRLIGPTFHYAMLEQFAVIQSEKAQILIKFLERKIEKNPGKAIDIYPFANKVALDIICEAAMGVNIHAQEAECEYVLKIHRFRTLAVDRTIRPLYWLNWLFYRTPMGKEYKSVIDAMHEFTSKVIAKRKRERKFGNDDVKLKSENAELDIGKGKRKAFLDALLNENEKVDTPITDDELRAQVDTFMFEGHDTTAVALTWALFLLGNNLDHQEKVHEELDQVFKDSKMPATAKELSQLKYLDRVIKEALRLYPSVPLIGRKLTKDVKIGDYTLNEGMTVTLSIILAHRNPDVWPDPDKFDPDRFLPENSRHRHPYAYIPFSAGPRNCIGQRFAHLEEIILLTAILRKWKVKSVKLPTELSYKLSLVCLPTEPVLLHFMLKENANK